MCTDSITKEYFCGVLRKIEGISKRPCLKGCFGSSASRGNQKEKTRTFALYFPPPPWLDCHTLLQPLNICTRMFFLPLITVLIVLIPTIPLKYNITNTSFTSSHLLPPLILTPALYIYLSYLHFLPQLLLFLSQLLFILHIHFLLFILHIYFLLYISIYSLITLYICTYSALFAILHFWLDAKLHFVASVLVLCAMTIKLNLI